MRQQRTIKHPHAYWKSVERKEYQVYRVIGLAQRRICQYLEHTGKALADFTRELLVHKLATDQSVTRGISLRSSGLRSFHELIDQAIGAMIDSGLIEFYQEECLVAIGLPNSTPVRVEQTPAIIESDPAWWNQLTNVRCAQPILRELATAY